eukprot:CAMPEP_0183345982 /NCGR_PEP_ID=MMETSP0164_2-20130417/11237_1 /TAXON_ID=221442 /ORGANISM="Coccolithus pelagicus ssp braarudi, Strain PLY182g" /LENGTH=54 /DNA_ID=CAMNT_0025517191 /DNA_START=28 /DNA_END=188 /DNA_ORIENTATION=+
MVMNCVEIFKFNLEPGEIVKAYEASDGVSEPTPANVKMLEAEEDVFDNDDLVSR